MVGSSTAQMSFLLSCIPFCPERLHESWIHNLLKASLCRQVLGVTLPALGIFRERTIANLANTIRKARIEQKSGPARNGHRTRQPSFTSRRRQALPPAPQTGARWAPTRHNETELSSSAPGRLVLPETLGHQRGASNLSSAGVSPESPGLSSAASDVGLLTSQGR